MRITLEPTIEDNLPFYNKVVIETQDDDMVLRDLWDSLIEPALLASTYQPGSIEDLILEMAYEIEDRASANTEATE